MFSWLFSDPLTVGTKAPDFTTVDDQGHAVKLSALRGKNVVLVFYPGDDTSVCTAQLCEFRDKWQRAGSHNTLVYGVNPAGSKSHEKFREKYQLPFPLIVDQGQKLAELYHANGLIVKRTVYLIGPDGVIRYGKRGKPSVSEVLAAAA
jgi:thioredoxin-dependent peroxiredoxin